MFGQLNSSQKEAVTHIDGSMLILGGAGSGKTVVITGRLGQILKTGKVKPHQIFFNSQLFTRLRLRFGLWKAQG